MTVLAFVEASEYRKELARQIARGLLSQLGVEGLLSGDPNQVAADLVSVLSEDLAGLTRQSLSDAIAHAVANGFDEISEADAQATLAAAVARVMQAAQGQLATRLAELDQSLGRMIDATSADAVQASIGSSATVDALLAPVSSILTAAAAGAVQAVEGDVGAEAAAAFKETAQEDGEADPLFEWQTREDDRVCEDVLENSCAPRHGKQLTYDEWGIFGMPGDPSAPTLCAIYAKNPGASNCRCVLIPAGSAASTPAPVKIAEAAKAGRDRALKEAA